MSRGPAPQPPGITLILTPEGRVSWEQLTVASLLDTDTLPRTEIPRGWHRLPALQDPHIHHETVGT